MAFASSQIGVSGLAFLLFVNEVNFFFFKQGRVGDFLKILI
tara:strand:- start:5989 stop:6111 length:123 start_codon:yes stop_codon:yes gene_type:complete